MAVEGPVSSTWLTRMQDRVRPEFHTEDITMNIFELKQEHKAALDRAEALLGAKDHVMSTAENEQYDNSMKRAEALERQIKVRQGSSTIHAMFPNGRPGLMQPGEAFAQPFAPPLRLAETRDPAYSQALQSFLSTGGKAHGDELVTGADGQGGYHIPGSESYTRQRRANGTYLAPRMGAALYEGSEGGSDSAGGYAINLPTVDQIVPLALPDLGIFDASMVIPTATDIKIPQQVSFGTSAIKAESTGTLATFGGSDPTLGQITLSAFMAGALRWVSWELMQDVANVSAVRCR